MKEDCRHQCFIYSGAPSLQLPVLAKAMMDMADKGYMCLYLNSSAMVTGMRSCIASMGVDVAEEVDKHRLIFSSEPVCVDDEFNIDDMLAKLEATIDEALGYGFKGLWASGDMTWELGSEKNHEKLLEYEFRLEALFAKRPELRGICQYHIDSLPIKTVRSGFIKHQSIFVNETLSRTNHFFMDAAIKPDAKVLDFIPDSAIASLSRTRD